MEQRKLHGSSPLFILIDNIKKLILPALIAVLGSGTGSWQMYALGAGALISIVSIVQYRFYSYWLEDDQIRVKEGILFRNLRQVKYDKIQNLNLIQGPLHRLMGVAKVQLESASGGKPEAVISVVNLAAVKDIQKRVDNESLDEKGNHEENEKQKNNPPIHSLSFSEIARYGIITNRGLIAVAIFFGFLSQFIDDDNPRNLRPVISKGVSFVNETIQSVVPNTSVMATIVSGVILFLIAVVFLWVLSIGMALFKFHGFSLQKKNTKLSATMGLLTRLKATIPISRIQTITVHNSLLHRLFKRIGVTIETAGGVNTEAQGITMKQVAPVIEASKRNGFLSQVQSEIEWDKMEWTLIEQRAWKRVFKVSLIIWALILLTTIIYSIWFYAATVTLAVVWSYIYAKLYVTNSGYYLSERMIAFKKGVIFKKEVYVRLPKIQTVTIQESMFDRRHKMATLEVDTAGGSIGALFIGIPYLNYETVESIQQFISSRIKTIEFEW